jgi:localization factor PodJL
LAEDLARRSGLTLNEWVSRLMAEGPEDATSQDYFTQSSSYVEAPRAATNPRYETLGHPADEVGRVTQAIERLSDRIEGAESRQALAIAGIERSVREVIARIDSTERDQQQVSARLESALQEARGETQRLTDRMRRIEEEAAGPRSPEALRAIEGALGIRIETAERAQAQVAARVEDEMQQVRGLADRLADRMRRIEEEAALARSSDALKSLEGALGGRLETAEREQAQIAARFEDELQHVRGEADRLADRMRRIEEEAAGPRTAEALRALEGALGKVAGHVYEGERRARELVGDLRGRVERLDAAEQATVIAIRELRNSCTALDGRLSLAQRGAEDGVERAAEKLAARVEATREELGRQLAAAADARFDRVEQALTRMTDHVRTAEQRSAGALEKMGREVIEIAQTLNRRVQAVEHQSAEAADRVGAEVARIAGAVEDRLGRADSIQAQALEKLGAEIARITERLADRIANAERRSAQAIDDVGEQVARVTERVSQRQERSVSELSERIRQSEERTARLLEEARLKIDDRLAETQKRLSEPPPRAAAAVYDEVDDQLFGDAPFPGYETPPAERPFPRETAPSPFAAPAGATRPEALTFDDEDFEAVAKYAAPEPEPQAEPEPEPAPAPVFRRPVAPDAAPPVSPPTMSLASEAELEDVELEPNVGFDVEDDFVAPVSQAFAAHRTAPPAEEILAAPSIEPDPEIEAGAELEEPQAASSLTTREVIERARAAARAASEGGKARASAPRPMEESVLQSLTFGRSRKRPGGMSGALMVASLLAAVGLSAGGYVFLEGKADGKLPKRVADALSVVTGDVSDPSPEAAGASPPAGPPLAAVAFAPKAASEAAAGPDLSLQYSQAVGKVTAGEAGGLAAIQKLADGGYAPAEFYLAELYQDGKAGLKKDAAQSRHWLERAAEAGDRTAMHNLALDDHEGIGGPRNAAAAAEWFRRAAELGLLDSQFNLAAVYEHGDGVSQNPAEAYKWYLIAARAGDAEAKAGALRVRAALTPDARAVAERAAIEFQPTQPDSSVGLAAASTTTPQPASPDLVTAQRALNQLGYYQGPTDGQASPALRLALAAYQRDQSLPVTGAPDAATIGKLQVYTR